MVLVRYCKIEIGSYENDPSFVQQLKWLREDLAFGKKLFENKERKAYFPQNYITIVMISNRYPFHCNFV